eukprot:7384981-Prymnesium_polylepis.1
MPRHGIAEAVGPDGRGEQVAAVGRGAHRRDDGGRAKKPLALHPRYAAASDVARFEGQVDELRSGVVAEGLRVCLAREQVRVRANRSLRAAAGRLLHRRRRRHDGWRRRVCDRADRSLDDERARVREPHHRRAEHTVEPLLRLHRRGGGALHVEKPQAAGGVLADLARAQRERHLGPVGRPPKMLHASALGQADHALLRAGREALHLERRVVERDAVRAMRVERARVEALTGEFEHRSANVLQREHRPVVHVEQMRLLPRLHGDGRDRRIVRERSDLRRRLLVAGLLRIAERCVAAVHRACRGDARSATGCQAAAAEHVSLTSSSWTRDWSRSTHEQ